MLPELSITKGVLVLAELEILKLSAMILNSLELFLSVADQPVTLP